MTEQELQNKIGAMHLRFLDDQVHYEEFVNVLMCYSESSDNYGQSVTAALRDGLTNSERYFRMESAISPRSIVIEKKSKGLNVSKADIEGCYSLCFILDDERKLKMHFDRKLSHLLYILNSPLFFKKRLFGRFLSVRGQFAHCYTVNQVDLSSYG